MQQITLKLNFLLCSSELLSLRFHNLRAFVQFVFLEEFLNLLGEIKEFKNYSINAFYLNTFLGSRLYARELSFCFLTVDALILHMFNVDNILICFMLGIVIIVCIQVTEEIN